MSIPTVLRATAECQYGHKFSIAICDEGHCDFTCPMCESKYFKLVKIKENEFKVDIYH